MKDWEKIYTTGDIMKSNILSAMLHENDIEFNIINKIETVTQASGLIEIYVKTDDAVRARNLISKSDLTQDEE